VAIEDFLQSLSNADSDAAVSDLCRKHVLHGTPHVFSGREDDYYEFRKRLAVKFDISFHEVFITGSAKLGFSPHKRTLFSYDSDVDVAIVSPLLYERMMETIREYQMSLRDARRAVTGKEIFMYHQFLEYAAIGWIRPDKLPLSFRVGELKRDWFDFFTSMSYGGSEVGDYKVSAGVFRSYRHLELYILSGLRHLKTSLEVG
jgi:hypothetical protein